MNKNAMPVFLHIPRTAGTSIQWIVEKQYEVDRILTIYGREIERPAMVVRQTDLSQYDMIRGHIAFGIHEAMNHPCRYFTIVRDPVDRVRSLYNYIRRSKNHHLYQGVSTISLRQFVLCGITAEVDNGQVRQLSGLSGDWPQTPYARPLVHYGNCTVGMLNQAIDNILIHQMLVGVTHRMEDSVRVFAREFGWRVLEVPTRNSAKGITLKEVDEGTRLLIEQHNMLDRRLFEFACGTLDCLLQEPVAP